MSSPVSFGDIVTLIQLILAGYEKIHGAPTEVEAAKVEIAFMLQVVQKIERSLAMGQNEQGNEENDQTSMLKIILPPLLSDLDALKEVLKKWREPPTCISKMWFGLRYSASVRASRATLSYHQTRFVLLLSTVLVTESSMKLVEHRMVLSAPTAIRKITPLLTDPIVGKVGPSPDYSGGRAEVHEIRVAFRVRPGVDRLSSGSLSLGNIAPVNVDNAIHTFQEDFEATRIFHAYEPWFVVLKITRFTDLLTIILGGTSIGSNKMSVLLNELKELAMEWQSRVEGPLLPVLLQRPTYNSVMDEISLIIAGFKKHMVTIKIFFQSPTTLELPTLSQQNSKVQLFEQFLRDQCVTSTMVLALLSAARGISVHKEEISPRRSKRASKRKWKVGSPEGIAWFLEAAKAIEKRQYVA